MSPQDERNRPDDVLKHDSSREGRKRDGLAINGDAGHSSIQVPANKPATRTTPMKVTEMSHPSPFFFCPPISRAWHKGMPSFLTGEGR